MADSTLTAPPTTTSATAHPERRAWDGPAVNRGAVCENMSHKEHFVFHGTGAGGADVLAFDFVVGVGGGVPMRHHHLHQEEVFRVKRGELTVHLGGGDRVVRAGEEITIAPGTMHAFTNQGDVDVVCDVEYRPAGRNEQWLKLTNALEAKLGRELGLLDIAPFLGDVGLFIEGPPVAVQRVLFAMCKVVAIALGKRRIALAAAREAYGPGFSW